LKGEGFKGMKDREQVSYTPGAEGVPVKEEVGDIVAVSKTLRLLKAELLKGAN